MPWATSYKRTDIRIDAKLLENYIQLCFRYFYIERSIINKIMPISQAYTRTSTIHFLLNAAYIARTPHDLKHILDYVWLMVNLNHNVFCILLFFYTCKDLRKVNVFVTRRKNSQCTLYIYINILYRVAIEKLVVRVLFVCRNVKQRIRHQDLALGLHNSNRSQE